MGGSARTGVAAFVAAVCAIAMLVANVSRAQTNTPLGNVNANRFRPAPGPGNYVETDGAQLSGHLEGSAGLMFDFASEPLSLFGVECTGPDLMNCGSQEVRTDLVSYMASFNLYGALVLVERLQIGLVLPLILVNGDGFSGVDSSLPVPAPVEIDGGGDFGLGDMELSFKVRFYGEGLDGLFLGSRVFVTAPLGDVTAPGRFIGEDSVTAGGHFIAQFVYRGFHISGNLGALWRSETQLLSTTQGPGLYYRAAAGYAFAFPMMLFVEIDGETGFDRAVNENPLEGLLTVRYTKGDFQVQAGGGGGFIGGIGVPTYRIFAGFGWLPDKGDQDGDGIEDGADLCRDTPEDKDGWEDTDGCPEIDNDHDGFSDKSDKCPDEAEDFDGTEDEDGCPDVDNDGDGIEDGYDSCPNEAEDKDGDLDEDGCPE